jgi:cytochrome b subunit of formate dehydrogenase
VKRLAKLTIILLGWILLIGAAAAQTTGGDGWPPQTALFQDAHLLAVAAPFIIGLAVLVGIGQARAASRGGGDALLGNEVRRHDTATILAHWMNAIGLIGCLVTGAMILRWTDRPLGLREAFMVHYFGAGLMLFGIFNHLSRHGVSGGTGLIPKSLTILRDVTGELIEYTGLFGPKGAVLRLPIPKAIRQPIAGYVQALLGYKPDRHGKYLATEQILSYPPWSIMMILIVSTGLIKLMKYVYPLPGEWISTATTIHDLTALAVGVMLVIHLLPLLLVPANWPLLLSMFRTTVKRSYVEERHPAWYRQLVKRAEAQGAASPPAPAPTPKAEAQTGD